MGGDKLPSAEQKVSILEFLEDEVTQRDAARDFLGLGGLGVIVGMIGNTSEDPNVLAAASWVLGTAVKNMKEMQLGAVKLGALSPLLDILKRYTNEAMTMRHVEVEKKVLYALTSICRGNSEAQVELVSLGGAKILADALTQLNHALTKATDAATGSGTTQKALVGKACRVMSKILTFVGDILDDESPQPTPGSLKSHFSSQTWCSATCMAVELGACDSDSDKETVLTTLNALLVAVLPGSGDSTTKQCRNEVTRIEGHLEGWKRDWKVRGEVEPDESEYMSELIQLLQNVETLKNNNL